MNKFLNVILVLGLALSVSCSEVTIQELNNLKFSQPAEEFIGQQLVDTVQLQLSTGGSVDTILRLLNGLVKDLQRQQAAHDAQRAKLNAAWKVQIANYNKVIKFLKARIARLSVKISQVRAQIRRSQRTIRILQEQIKLVNQKLASLNAARAVDHAAYVKRTARQSEILKAVNYIIGALQTALKNGKYVQLNEIKEQLAKLAKENPIEAFVELSMTFNPKSVQYAITKLSEIRSALEASLQDEAQHEAAAVKAVNALRSEIRAFIRHSKAALARAQARLAAQQQRLARLRTARREARRLLALNRSLRAQARAARKAYNAIYRKNTAHRLAEIAVVNQVIAIVKAQQPATQRADNLKFSH